MATRQLHRLTGLLTAAYSADRLADEPDADLLDRCRAGADPAAFETIVRRHGNRVLAACRKVLGDPADVDDAFQATFLTLLRNPRAVRKAGSLGAWLYGVGHRIAVRARDTAGRRRALLMKAAGPVDTDPADLSWREACTALHAELDKLPDALRLPLVLCYLEGLSRDEAAQQLGWSLNEVRGRLERGRLRLRKRLEKRGIALSAGLLAAVAGNSVTAGVPPTRCIEGAMRALSGRPSAGAAALAHGASPAMFATKCKLVPGLVLAAGLFVAIAAVDPTNLSVAGPPKPPTAKADEIKPAVPAQAETVAVKGRVLGPDGRPVAGAKLYLSPSSGYLREGYSSPEYATTGADGRFEFTGPKAKLNDWITVAAVATNYGAGWVNVRKDGKKDDLTLQLVKDDTPITGQIVDLEGKPVPGATLRVMQINAAPGEDLGPWLEAAKGKKGLALELEQQYLRRYTIAVSPKVTSDAEGRFRLTGIGRDRLVRAQLDGPTIASQTMHILTRPGKTIEVIHHKGHREYGETDTVTTYYGADFRHAAAPGQPIVGVVRDKDTKKPLSGVTIRGHAQVTGPSKSRSLDVVVQAKTDSEGRYRLTGMPKGKGYSIAAIPDRDQPYIVKQMDVPDGVGLVSVTVDVELKRGVWIEGKMTDKVTGKPLRGGVEYFSLYSNPNLRDYPGFDGTFLMDRGVATNEDGSFRVVGLPGPGLIGVYYHRDYYLRAPDRDDEFGVKEKSLLTSPYHLSFTSNYNAIARVDPAKGVDSERRDVTLDPGWTFTGTVLGPDGKPLTGVRSYDLNGFRWDREEMETAKFSGWFNPRRSRDLLFQHLEKGLIGVAKTPKENGGAVTVRMGPGAAVTGRLVDSVGKPRAGVELEVSFRPKAWTVWYDYSPERIRTDREGRFRFEALLPGYEFDLRDDRGHVSFGDDLRSGAVKDLGDVRCVPAKE